MAHITTNAGFGSRASVLNKFKSYLRAQAKHRSDRLTYSRMMRMSNRDLADIGLTRDDVREVMARPTVQFLG